MKDYLTVGGGERFLRWSPDGRRLLVNGYDAEDRQGLFLVDVVTGEASAVALGVRARYGRWSHDGKAVFFARGVKSQASRIVMRVLATGEEKVLYSPDTRPGLDNIQSLDVSPDGRWLAFSIIGLHKDSGDETAVMVVPAEGGEPKLLFRVPGSDWPPKLRVVGWTPDGREVLFTRDSLVAKKPSTVVWRIPAEGGEPQKLDLGINVIHNIRFHPDGQRIAFDSGQPKAEVWVMENFLSASPATPSGMVARQVWAGPGVDILGTPSPHGRFLSFVDWSTGDLAVRALATGEKRRLTNKGSWADSVEFAEYSVFSPDGKQVAYAWFNKDWFYDLRIIGIDGSGARVLYTNQDLRYIWPAAWSQDGKYVLATFFRTDRTNQIALVSVADGSVRVVKTLDWRYPQKMSLSPDGHYITYDFPPQEDSPERDIFLLSTDGSREIPLIQHPANDFFPVWAPDGKRILFVSDRTGSLSA